jgi:hypothetical protein
VIQSEIRFRSDGLMLDADQFASAQPKLVESGRDFGLFD